MEKSRNCEQQDSCYSSREYQSQSSAIFLNKTNGTNTAKSSDQANCNGHSCWLANVHGVQEGESIKADGVKTSEGAHEEEEGRNTGREDGCF